MSRLVELERVRALDPEFPAAREQIVGLREREGWTVEGRTPGEWVELLATGRPNRRARARRVLMRLGGDATLLLARRLRRGDAQVRARMLSVLTLMPEPLAGAGLEELWLAYGEDPSGPGAEELAELLAVAQRRDPTPSSERPNLLLGADALLRRQLLEELSANPQAEAHPWITEAISSCPDILGELPLLGEALLTYAPALLDLDPEAQPQLWGVAAALALMLREGWEERCEDLPAGRPERLADLAFKLLDDLRERALDEASLAASFSEQERSEVEAFLEGLAVRRRERRFGQIAELEAALLEDGEALPATLRASLSLIARAARRPSFAAEVEDLGLAFRYPPWF